MTLIVPKFRQGITLYDYQIETMSNIIQAESARNFSEAECHYVLTEPFGSGKTFVVMGLIMANPIPPIAPIPLYRAIYQGPYLHFTPTRANQIIRPTAIVVARSVYAQWVRNLSTYTSLRTYEARDKIAVDKLVVMIMNGDINDYDVVLVKYGQTNCLEQCDARADGKLRDELCCIINSKTLPLIWSRVVYDDVDLISEAMCMRACSSVFVTGATDYHRRLPPDDFDSCPIQSFNLRDTMVRVPRVAHVFSPRRSQVLSGVESLGGAHSLWATLGHSPEVIARDHGVFAIRWLNCAITNREVHRATTLMEGIEAVDCTELLRMINGDAMVSAARLLSISVVTPSAMFASVLGTQREDHDTASARLDLMTRLRSIAFSERHISREDCAKHNLVASASEDRDPSGTERMHISELREGILARLGINVAMRAQAERPIRSIDVGSTIPRHTIELMSATDDVIDGAIAQIRAYLAKLDRSFVRIQENMASQMCSVCYGELRTEHVTIMRCCGYTLCASCCARGSRFERTRDSRVVGTCVQCRQPLDVARDVIFVESGINVDSLVKNALSSRPDEVSTVRASTEPPVHILTKTAYVAALIRGEIKYDSAGLHGNFGSLRISRGAVPDIRGVMNGTQEVEPRERMFLICVSFDETAEDISMALHEQSIAHEILQGTVSEFAAILARYTSKEVRVLIINVRALYAGVDLQCTTDIVIVDSTRVENIGQLVGRAQRLGRDCSLTVHSLAYVAGCEPEECTPSKESRRGKRAPPRRGGRHGP